MKKDTNVAFTVCNSCATLFSELKEKSSEVEQSIGETVITAGKILL